MSIGVIAAAAAAGYWDASFMVTGAFDAFINGGMQVAAAFAGIAPKILTVAIGIRLVKSLLEAMYDDSLMGTMEDVMNLALVGLILWVAIGHNQQIGTFATSAMNEVMKLMDVTGAQGAGDSNALARVWQSCVGVATSLMAFVFRDLKCDGGGSALVPDSVECLSTVVSSILPAMMMLLILIMVVVYALLMVLQFFVGAAMIGIGIGFLPLTLALYPLVESWAKNNIGLIVSGIAHMGICTFLMGLVSVYVEGLTEKLQGDPNVIEGLPGGDMVALLFVGAFLIILALTTSKAVGFASSIFGSTSGMIGRIGGRSGGGAGGGSSGAGGSSGSNAATKGAAPSGGGAALGSVPGGGAGLGGGASLGGAGLGAAAGGAAGSAAGGAALAGATGGASGLMGAAKGAMSALGAIPGALSEQAGKAGGLSGAATLVGAAAMTAGSRMAGAGVKAAGGAVGRVAGSGAKATRGAMRAVPGAALSAVKGSASVMARATTNGELPGGKRRP